MYNCIFTPHCTESFCDKSCPTLVETSYLLERNRIDMNSPVFRDLYYKLDSVMKDLSKQESGLQTFFSNSRDSVKVAQFITYCEICKNWKGSRLHCSVYNLQYSRFLDDVKKSWGLKSEPEDLEYTRIWIDTAKVLVISNMDYVRFGDFETQTLLNILQSRQSSDKKTIVVTPNLSRLVTTGSGSSSSSLFFESLKQILISSKAGVVELK